MRRLITLLLVLATTGAHAYCGKGHPSIEQEYADSSVVFRGLVNSSRQVPSAKGFEEGVVYTLAVQELVRGKLGRTVDVFSENSSGRFPMKHGAEYLIFAYRDRGRLSVDNCGNSSELPASTNALQAARRLSKRNVR